jgi:hypothetical protein
MSRVSCWRRMRWQRKQRYWASVVCEGKGNSVGEKVGIVGIVFVTRLAIIWVQYETVWVKGVERRISLLLRITLGAAPATQTISSRAVKDLRGGSFKDDQGGFRTRLILGLHRNYQFLIYLWDRVTKQSIELTLPSCSGTFSSSSSPSSGVRRTRHNSHVR